MGFTDEDLSRPLIGVANTWIEVMPCNFHLRQLAEKVKAGIRATGAHAAGKMSTADLKDLEDHACPGPGACGGQFTANTMSIAFEFLGISPMGYNGVPAVDPRKDEVAFKCGEMVMELLRKDPRPKQLITRKALENAIAPRLS